MEPPAFCVKPPMHPFFSVRRSRSNCAAKNGTLTLFKLHGSGTIQLLIDHQRIAMLRFGILVIEPFPVPFRDVARLHLAPVSRADSAPDRLRQGVERAAVRGGNGPPGALAGDCWGGIGKD